MIVIYVHVFPLLQFFEDRQTFSVVTKFGFAVFAGVCAVRSEYYGHGKLKYEDEDE